MEDRGLLSPKVGQEESGAGGQVWGPGRGALRERTNQSTCMRPEGGERPAFEIPAHVPGQPPFPVLPEGLRPRVPVCLRLRARKMCCLERRWLWAEPGTPVSENVPGWGPKDP